WTSFRSGIPDPSVYGGYPVDVHGIPTNPTVKDTFLLNITYIGPNADFSDFHLLWPRADSIAEHCDSLILVPKTAGLQDDQGNVLPARINMSSTTHLTLLQPVQAIGSNSFRFQIWRYGVKYVEHLDGQLPIIL